MTNPDDRLGSRVLDPIALDRLWDAMQRQFVPVGGRTGALSIEAAETIHQLTTRDDAPRIADSQAEAIWLAVASSTFAPTISAPAVTADSRAGAPSIWGDVQGSLQRGIRQAAIGAIAGILIGFVVIGGGARLFMRFAAMLADPNQQGALTANGNEVGTITLAGSVSLLIAGAIAGLLGGIVVMAVRPWLPASGLRRSLLAGAVGFAVAGPIVLEGGSNPDYRRFGVLGVNVCLFTLLPFLFGVCVIPLVDAIDRRLPSNLPTLRSGLAAAGLSLILSVLALPAIPALKTALNLDPAGLLMLLPFIRLGIGLWCKHASTLAERRKREVRGLRIGYMALIVPCLLGLMLMAQSLTHLLR